MRRTISSLNIFSGESLWSEANSLKTTHQTSHSETTDIGQNETERLVLSCQFRLIFNKENSDKNLSVAEKLLKEVFLKIAVQYQFPIVDVSFTHDHVQLLIGLSPEYSISQYVNDLKEAVSKITFNSSVSRITEFVDKPSIRKRGSHIREKSRQK